MKRIIISAFAALYALVATAATTTPPSLINPTGSTSGQAIVSTGPSTAPVWGSPSVSSVTGVLPIANGGTGATTASAARSNLSAAFTGANTLTGAQTLAYSSPTLTLSDSSGTGTSRIQWQNNGTNVWSTVGDSSTSQWRLQRYVSGTLVDNPITVSNSTGVTTFVTRPVFGSATPWDSANLASPASTTGATFTGAITPSQTAGIVGTTTNNNANAGSIGEYLTNSSTGSSLTTATFNNSVTRSLTAGDWDVECVNTFNPAGTTTVSLIQSGVSTVSATGGGIGTGALFQGTMTTGAQQIQITPVVRISLASTATVYCVAAANFGVSTMTVDGFIRARRVR